MRYIETIRGLPTSIEGTDNYQYFININMVNVTTSGIERRPLLTPSTTQTLFCYDSLTVLEKSVRCEKVSAVKDVLCKQVSL